ncbi:MAG: hypothetical protein JXA06_01945 [Bacteroidetes bacterium]|nr:hypothetical protein [Bacteroidota bacterium]
MPEFHFSFTFSIVVLLAAAVCAFAIAAYVYRTTVPPVSPFKKKVLIFLRGLGLFLLFLLIGEPILTLIVHSADQPVLAVLIDNSQSMTITDKTGKRDEKLKTALGSPVWKQIAEKGKIEYYAFDRKAYKLTAMDEDSLTFPGEETDIAGALNSIKRESVSSNLQSVVIISDGNSTVGMNPLYEAEELDLPVFTIGVGDTIEQKDVLVRKVLTNEIAYLGAKVPVNIIVHSTGFGGERVQVSLHEGPALADERTLLLEPGTRDYPVSLSFIAAKEGMQKYRIEVSQLTGELTQKNNNMSFFTKILKSKIRATMIAGSPSQDAASIKRILANDSNVELKTFIERSDGQFYEAPLDARIISESDCLILAGFPNAASSTRIIGEILKADKPVMTIMNRTMDFNKLQTMDQLLPFRIESAANDEIQVFADVPEMQRNNSILKVGSTANIIDAWSKLPPVFQPKGIYKAKVESEILASVRLQPPAAKNPFIVARNINRKKSVSVLGYGLWRWNMLSGSGSESEKVLESFLSNAIRWLTTQEDSKKIVIRPVKQFFSTRDAVEFSAQAYDDSYQPMDDVQIEVRVERGNDIYQIPLELIGSGQYQGEIAQLPEGDYNYTAEAKKNGVRIGDDKGTFTVGSSNVEYLETRMNKQLLQQIAAQTGGQYFDCADMNLFHRHITGSADFKARDFTRSAEIEIWNSRWMLALVVLVFALEWFLRKRNGLL